MSKQIRHVASVPSPEARANVQAVPKGNVWRRHGISNGYYWESSGMGWVEPPVYRRRQQRLWMSMGREAAVIPGVLSNGMNGRKREGTVEIPRGRRRPRRRKRSYKAQAEVVRDAGWEVGGGHIVAMKARTAKPAGAKGLYSSHAYEGGRTV